MGKTSCPIFLRVEMTSYSVLISIFSLSFSPSSESGGTRSWWTSTIMRSFFFGSKAANFFFFDSEVIRQSDDNPNAARSLPELSKRSLRDGVLLFSASPRVALDPCNDRSYSQARGRWCTGERRCLRRRFDEPRGVHCEETWPRWDSSDDVDRLRRF